MAKRKKRAALSKDQGQTFKESLKQFLGPSLIDNHIAMKPETSRIRFLKEAFILRVLK